MTRHRSFIHGHLAHQGDTRDLVHYFLELGIKRTKTNFAHELLRTTQKRVWAQLNFEGLLWRFWREAGSRMLTSAYPVCLIRHSAFPRATRQMPGCVSELTNGAWLR